MTSVPHPQADEDGRSQGIKLRERAAFLQLCCFPPFNEVDGPRHASCETVSPSNLGRPLCDRSLHCTTSGKLVLTLRCNPPTSHLGTSHVALGTSHVAL